MVDKGNVDKHRQSYGGMKGVVEESKWGRSVAEKRYGKLDQPNTRPKDTSFPQFKEDQRGPDWADDTSNDWRRGFGKGGVESAEGRPGYVPGYRPKK